MKMRKHKTSQKNRYMYKYYIQRKEVIISSSNDNVDEELIEQLHKLDDEEYNNNRRHFEKKVNEKAAMSIMKKLTTSKNPEKEYLKKEKANKVAQVLNLMGPRQKDVLEQIVYKQNMDAQEYAKVNNLNIETVYQTLKRAKKSFRKIYKKKTNF